MRFLHAFLILPGVAFAQTPSLKSLPPAEAEFREPFTAISSVRELSDGRVIVSDRSDKTLQLVDLKAGTATSIGRTGSGPSEFGLPGRLHAQRGDTTLLNDGENLRYLMIAPGGRVLTSFRFDDSEDVRMIDMASMITVDGAYYFIDSKYAPGPRGGEIAQFVVRRRRGNARMDTVTTLAIPAGRSTAARDVGNGLLFMYNSRPLAAEDAVAFASDGRIAVVRGADYHVEWIRADGRIVKGPAISYDPIRVNDAVKKEYAVGQTRPGKIQVYVPPGVTPPSSGGSGAARSGVMALPPGFDPFKESDVQWPATVAPFFAGAAMIAGDRLWVQRSRAPGDSIPKYDVFDGRGVLVERIALPKGTRLVGFGNKTVYLARIDADDLQYLQRYRVN